MINNITRGVVIPLLSLALLGCGEAQEKKQQRVKDEFQRAIAAGEFPVVRQDWERVDEAGLVLWAEAVAGGRSYRLRLLCTRGIGKANLWGLSDDGNSGFLAVVTYWQGSPTSFEWEAGRPEEDQRAIIQKLANHLVAAGNQAISRWEK